MLGIGGSDGEHDSNNIDKDMTMILIKKNDNDDQEKKEVKQTHTKQIYQQ